MTVPSLAEAAADPSPLAAIDIGTNSVHLVVARASGNNRFEVVDRAKEVVRLGTGSGDMKLLSADAIERGLDTLRRFQRIAASFGADVHAVATSAVREADNRDEFLRRAEAEAGVRVEIISGPEEARLIRLGVLQAVPVYDQRHLVIDIGGGSTEFVVGEGSELLLARSLKLGAIRLTERFGLAEGARRKAVLECRRYVRTFLSPLKRSVLALGFDVAVGSSGTIVNLAAMARAVAGEAPLQLTSGATLSAEGLAVVVEQLTAARTLARRSEVPGLESKRADIILGGALILEQAFAELGITEMVISDSALREGVLLDRLRRRDRTSIGHLRDLRFESVAHLAAVTPEEGEHAALATDLAIRLFEATRDRHGMGEEFEELLEAAGLLANVGLFISHDKHHLHSYYIIRNSELLTGFTDHEVELIAQVARYHRKSAPKSRHEAFARLDADDQRTVRLLAGCLRVGIALDRTRSSAVKSMTVRGDDHGFTVTIDSGGSDAELELYTAESRKGLLEDALGVPVAFVLAGDARTTGDDVDPS
ncbi:MAG: Ppx/GppA phosphatase family protein [Acidimicrobiia bacterium]